MYRQKTKTKKHSNRTKHQPTGLPSLRCNAVFVWSQCFTACPCAFSFLSTTYHDLSPYYLAPGYVFWHDFSPGQGVPHGPATFLLFKSIWAVLKSCSMLKSGQSSPVSLTAAQSWLLVLTFQERAPNLLGSVFCFYNQWPSMPHTPAVMVAKLLITFFSPDAFLKKDMSPEMNPPL